MASTSLRLKIYQAWVDTWLSTTDSPTIEASFPSLEELVPLFREENLIQLQSGSQLKQTVILFKHLVRTNQLTLGGKIPPSCDETNVVSGRYDPRTNCSCSGLYPVPPGFIAEDVVQQSGCLAIRSMVEAEKTVNARLDEWNASIFTKERLQDAVTELIMFNADEQPPPHICRGSATDIPAVQAPDRRPDLRYDTEPSLFHQLYPTEEQIKICADAKYFFAMACGAGQVDEGLARAVIGGGNDILIGDYCEAGSEETLTLLQRVGAASMAFLKLCTMTGDITDWHFDNMAALLIQFRVLSYYRDHARSRMPQRVYGTRMTGLGVLSHKNKTTMPDVLCARSSKWHRLENATVGISS